MGKSRKHTWMYTIKGAESRCYENNLVKCILKLIMSAILLQSTKSCLIFLDQTKVFLISFTLQYKLIFYETMQMGACKKCKLIIAPPSSWIYSSTCVLQWWGLHFLYFYKRDVTILKLDLGEAKIRLTLCELEPWNEGSAYNTNVII